ncbi:MAG: hypothetical protein ABI451_01790 [Dokdonella sp.]
MSVRRIPQGQVYTMRRVGGHTRVLSAGTHLVVPLLERVAHKIQLTGNMLAFDTASASTAPMRATLYFQVIEPERADPVIDGVSDLLHSRVNQLLGDAALPPDLLERRHWLKQTINSELRERGLLVTRVELDNAA